MKTEQEWLDLYHECWKIFGNNNVRLMLGQFGEVDRWAKIEIVGFDIRYSIDYLKKVIQFCESNKLRVAFDHYGEINLYEDYEEEGFINRDKTAEPRRRSRGKTKRWSINYDAFKQGGQK